MTRLARLSVRGFKSIARFDNFPLGQLNVLIGANGAGKSNFISLFRMLAEMVDGRLQLYVKKEDGPDALLFGGRKQTKQLEVELYFGTAEYRFGLAPAAEQLVFTREVVRYAGSVTAALTVGGGHLESRLSLSRHDPFTAAILPAIRSWRVFHFHDTSASAPVRQAQATRDNLRLKPDASNLSPFLRMLREKYATSYSTIVATIRMVAPFFGDFVHRLDAGERVELEWLEVDDPDTPRGPRQLSDGTLRFICLATLLLQPAELQPDTIIVDEPELGLHPYALAILGSLLAQASESKQIIVSTQSAELVNQFAPADVIVTERHDGGSVFRRPNGDQLKEWLEEYSLGELWKMNVVGGRPSR